MPYLDSLDIANRALQHVGAPKIYSIGEDSRQNLEVSFVYDKVRRAELRRNIWTFSVKRAALRSLTATTRQIVPALWNANQLYLQGAICTDANGYIWLSMEADNLGNEPGSSASWDQYFGPMTADLYDSTISYYAGELVYAPAGNPGGFVVFMSLISGNTDVPGTATPYDATAIYTVDDEVAYLGTNYRSMIPYNKANTPANAPIPFSITTTYSIGQTVAGSDGYIYSSVGNGNVGNDPVLDAGVHWTNTTVPAAWTTQPAMFTTSNNWQSLYCGLIPIRINYPIGSGPTFSSAARSVFRLPANFLREAPQRPRSGAGSYYPSGLYYTDYEFDGVYLTTSDTTAVIVLRFAGDIVDVTKMDDMFCEGFACRIAEGVSEPLTQSSSKLQQIAAEYKVFMGEARTVNAIEQGPTEPPEDDYITARA